MHSSEQKALLESIKKDPSRFSIVFDAYYAVIFSYILHRVANYETARDIASETFLKAFLHINSFKWKGISVLSWLYRIATNECNLYFRKKRYKPDSADNMIAERLWDMVDPASTLEERSAIEKEMQLHTDFMQVQQKIMQLPVAYQEVLTLRYFEEKNIKEIAMILDKKEGTVKSLLSRAIEKLRNML